ncbi:unnamed protein product [Rhizoctonia solani]|uniref:Uncharacterized protein n=1 Tax=Rhizoctonia solani TaxID=456999 RepID=A0A8H3CWD1_9AGAM|nr:unnamed protein product [Rhizoctonia solani]
MPSSTFSPLPTSSFQPLTSISPPLVSSNRLFNRCKGERDYRERTRITFPGGWNHEDDDVFQWYHSQPYRRFQAIEYYKERAGVQHEFIRVLLQNDQGDLVGSFCRIERVADVEHRIEAIRNQGTTAFDFVQTIDPSHPIDSEHPNPSTVDDSDIELVARISFPHAFDLVDILAICFGIHKHPQAKNYTLQQFNCYFFSWTIILCLARRAADWNGLLRNHTDTLRQAVLQHLGNLRSSGNLTVWSIMFGLHDDQTDTSDLHQSPSQITERILSELSGEVFKNAVEAMLSRLLWHDQDPSKLQAGLKDSLEDIARDTSGSMLEDRSLTSRRQSRVRVNPLGIFESELARICATTWVNRVILSLYMDYRKDLERHHTQCAKRIPSVKRVAHILLAILEVGIGRALFSPIDVPCYVSLLLINLYEHQVSVQRRGGTPKYFRKPVAFVKTVKGGPKALWNSFKWYIQETRVEYRRLLSESAANTEGTPRPLLGPRVDYAVRVLSESLNIYSTRHGESSTSAIRENCAKAIEYFCSTIFADEYTMSHLWTASFRDDLGNVIIQSLLDIVKQPTSDSSFFQWVPEPTAHETSTTDTDSFRLTHTELQNRIRERIIQLSRWEVEGSPIAPYMRHVTFTTPAKESQAEMERAIEDIWGTCGPLMKSHEAERSNSVA